MSELLSTKLFIPRRRSTIVARPRLTERLNASLDKKLALIAAPAGFGKTTLLSEWIPQSPRCVTWYSLDEGDNDPAQFWAYFIASLQGLRSDLGAGAMELLQSPQASPLQSILTALINDLNAFPDVFAFVLDDYHFIETQSIHEGLAFLLAHLPANMHLVVTTRVDPPFPLARLRASDKLTELRANDLRFTAGEVAAFLTDSLGFSLPETEVAALETRTEGWIAGLQIAALSMHNHTDVSGFIQAFSGSHRHVMGYLAEEVINQRPKGTLDFLLQTSILDRLCGPLCDAVTGTPGGQAHLEDLEQANMFISALDDDGVWFRYHHMFAEVLQLRLRQTMAGQVRELHRRAQMWLEENGLMHEAVRHALAAEDYDHAADMIERLLSANWLRGELKTLQGWLAALPAEAWQPYPRLWLVQAWLAMTMGDLVQGDRNLQAAEEALAALDEKTARPLRAEVMAFRASYYSLAQDPRALDLAQKALQELPEDYWLRGMLIVFLGAAYYSVGDLEAALEVLTQAPGFGQPVSGAQPHRIHLLTFTGTVLYARGKLNEAMKLLRQSVEWAEPGGVPIPFVGTLLAYMSLAPVLYERNELEQAEQVLSRGLELAVSFGSAEVQVYILSLLASICLARGDVNAAQAYYDRVDILLKDHVFSSSIMAYVDYRRFQLYLKQGNLAAAEGWVNAHSEQTGSLNPYAFHRLAVPQLWMAEGAYETALPELETLVEETQTSGHGSLLVKALVLQAEAFQATGRSEDALDALERVLILAEAEGFIRPFIDQGQPIRTLLLEYQSILILRQRLTEKQDLEIGRRLSFIGQLLAASSPTAPEEKKQAGAGLETLSERELDILQLIAQGYSNQEIAEHLVIAISTVKSHINSLYSKLGTHSRTRAIVLARETGLLLE